MEPGYRLPPASLAAVVDAPLAETAQLSPDRSRLALYRKQAHPSLSDLSRPTLNLAGLRFNPRNHGPADADVEWLAAISILDIATGERRNIELHGQRAIYPQWSPDGRWLAYHVVTPDRVTLWLADREGRARQLPAPRLSAIDGPAFQWLPDSSGFLVRWTEASAMTDNPAETAIRPGLHVSTGQAEPERTYQGLLKNEYQARQLASFATVNLSVARLTPALTLEWQPCVAQLPVTRASVSPDGAYLLLERLTERVSHSVPLHRFPRVIEVRSMASGRVVALVDHRQEALPQALDPDAVAAEPRHVQWQGNAPASLIWAYPARDAAGDDRADDALYRWQAPFDVAPQPLARLSGRFAGVFWGHARFALVFSRRYKTRQEHRTAINPMQADAASVYWTQARNYQDRENAPGVPLLDGDPAAGRLQLSAKGDYFYLRSVGNGTQAGANFLDRVAVASGGSQRLWRSDKAYHENAVALLDPERLRLLLRRQSQSEPPDYVVFEASDAGNRYLALTHTPDPLPAFSRVRSETLHYRRADGVALSGKLYLPPGYEQRRDGPLPVLIWIYPVEYTGPEFASQSEHGENRFTRPVRINPIALALEGFAVFERPSMPVVAAPGSLPNDRYVPQLQMNAEAAVAALVARGVADPKRIAIGGHSYGAFSAVNLLARSKLFSAGIALSGAYNRTLTPFGFQSEIRNLWQAPEVYWDMSPFMAADRITAPLLLVHGVDDQNAGTHPLQSQRLFAALKGLGKEARYVELPYEGHGYRARESLLHVLAEMHGWLDAWLRKP